MYRKILIIVLFALILSGFAAIFITAHHLLKNPSLMAPQQRSHPVIVINMSDIKTIDDDAVLQGKVGVLTIVLPPDPKRQGHHHFNSVSALQNYDLNKDGRLDAQDPIFSHMELMFFADNGKKHQGMSLPDAKIQALVFDLKPVMSARVNQAVNMHVGQALMANGTKHDIYLLSLSVNTAG